MELEFEGPGFVAVPNSVVDDERLSADALAVLVYLARLSGGRGPRVVRVAAICKRFEWGKDKWQRVARELRAVGALSDNFDGRTPDGRHIVRSLSVGWPKAKPKAKPVVCEPENPAHRKRRSCEPENPAHRAENPAEVCRKTRLLKKEQTEARADAAFTGGKAAARASGGDVEKDAVGKASADAASRSRLAASLGLPVFDPVSGGWLRPAAQAALEKKGAGDEIRLS